MNLRFPCISVLLLSCCALTAQTPAPPSAANPAADATTAAAPEIEQFQKIEDAWSNAVNARDQYALELVLSPLFVDISGSGDITTRNQQLADVITGEDKTVHLQQHVITVRMLGDTAVANGTYTLHHKVGSKEVDEKGVFTQVFERQRNRWMCVNSQRTVIHSDQPGSKKKSSRAEMPFHFPIFSRDEKPKQ